MKLASARCLAASAALCVAGCNGGSGGGSDAPAAPTALTATIVGTDVQLAWTGPASATTFTIYYDIVPEVTRSSAKLIGTSTASPALVAAQPSSTAYFAVTAVDAHGESALSSVVLAAVPSSGVDPLFNDEWHLVNTGQAGGTLNEDIDVASAWAAGFDGTGARIAVVDDGLEIAHEDLFWNCLPGRSHNYLDGSTDPTGGAHGTCCAGVAAAVGGNGLGVRGAAFEAQLVGYNLLASMTSANEANSMARDARENWISSNSWGAPDGLAVPQPSSASWRAAIRSGLTMGRAGKGLLYLWAAGNGAHAGADPGDNSNLDGRANYYGVIAVGAVGDDGKKASYSENGANVFVCAPSMGRANHAITTVDRTGLAGRNDGQQVGDYLDPDYTNTFNGTSSATPLAAGVVALVLQANPNLTWRDVRYVLARSARVNDFTDPEWTNNLAGYAINHKYGFGVVDAAGAIATAQTWVNVPPLITYTTPTSSPNLAIPDDDVLGVTDQIIVNGSGIQRIEHVEIVFDADDHPFSGDLLVGLVAPSGTISILAERHDCPQGALPYDNFHFGSVRYLDEPADGFWTLVVRDLAPQHTGTFKSWSLIFRGH